MERRWEDFYGELTISKYLRNLYRHRTLFEEIMVHQPKKVLEVGVGSGSMSIFLSHLGIKTYGLDYNPRVLAKAKSLAKRLNASVCWLEANAFERIPLDGKIDVSFSQGLLEHFSDDNIVKLVENQLQVSRRVVISVPSIYHFSSFGDERLLTLDDWKYILRDFGLIKAVYYGKEWPISRGYTLTKLKTFRWHHFFKPHHILITAEQSR